MSSGPGTSGSTRCRRAPLGDLVDIGFAAAYLATPLARHITGTTMYVDGGVNIMA